MCEKGQLLLLLNIIRMIQVIIFRPRINGDRSFHCDVCGVCLDVQLRGNHKCRPDSAHDECCICLEVNNLYNLFKPIKLTNDANI